MLHVYEFEMFEEDGWFIVTPFDMEGATSGHDKKEAVAMAVDWLKTDMEHRAMHDIPLPNATFDNTLQHGGERLIVAVEAGKDTVPRTLPSEAARRLGVSPGRVSHMMRDGVLETFEDAGKTWVTQYSVDARLVDPPKAGRPKRKTTT